ncbi:MAG: hydratase, partial [Oscillospiraceae bacterium]|nr:hydratase [Oscillospiraceae bacterium]
MVRLFEGGAILNEGGGLTEVRAGDAAARRDVADLRKGTIAYGILQRHSVSGDPDALRIKFDALTSHDITYVGIVQTARGSGLKRFPVPYVMTNCHNSLCTVGGTINEDDHAFGLSAARKYGGVFVPAHQAVIHQYMRETRAECGNMVLGSDSHTRYGALGSMGIGEGGGEIAKQLLGKTYDLAYPEVVAVYLEGSPPPYVGPQDVALALIKATFASGFAKNKVLEFIGPAIGGLSVDFRNGLDVMTTETGCLSSIWETCPKVEGYYKEHGRPGSYARLRPGVGAYYDGAVMIDLSKARPMIALPFHPSNAYTIAEFKANAADLLESVEHEAERQFGKANVAKGALRAKIGGGGLAVDQGIIAGCAGGTYENLALAADMLKGGDMGDGAFSLKVYPASQPVHMALVEGGYVGTLIGAGAVVKTAFCGPCFGADEIPANGQFSVRHTTRNFPSREGAKPNQGQAAYVALMDARSIAATAAMGGMLTGADEVGPAAEAKPYRYDGRPYARRVYDGFGRGTPDTELVYGPNIRDWPAMGEMKGDMLLCVASAIHDEVTTTDELIPSGDTSSYRSNPLRLAEFTLSKRDPGYHGRAVAVKGEGFAKAAYTALTALAAGAAGGVGADKNAVTAAGSDPASAMAATMIGSISTGYEAFMGATSVGSAVAAVRPGDGSAREQAASCQKVLGGWANVAVEYATKRYRGNLINWGLAPFTADRETLLSLEVGDLIYVRGICDAIREGSAEVDALLVRGGGLTALAAGGGASENAVPRLAAPPKSSSNASHAELYSKPTSAYPAEPCAMTPSASPAEPCAEPTSVYPTEPCAAPPSA